MSADTLTATSRAFLERSKLKLTLSIVFGGAGMIMLGMCAQFGGISASEGDIQDNLNDDDGSHQALKSGHGFASFCYILAFLLFSAGAVYASPLIMGSNNEKKMISSPQEIDSGYAAYGEDTPQSNV